MSYLAFLGRLILWSPVLLIGTFIELWDFILGNEDPDTNEYGPDYIGPLP